MIFKMGRLPRCALDEEPEKVLMRLADACPLSATKVYYILYSCGKPLKMNKPFFNIQNLSYII